MNSGSDVEFDSDGLFGVLVVEHIYSRGKVTVFLLLNYLILKAGPNHSGKNTKLKLNNPFNSILSFGDIEDIVHVTKI